MLAPPGRMRVVALWVKVKALSNLKNLMMPGLTLSKAVMAVVPVIRRLLERAAPMLVVAAEATSSSWARFSGMFSKATLFGDSYWHEIIILRTPEAPPSFKGN